MTRLHDPASILLVCAITALLRCSGPSGVAGGASGTDISAGVITGTVVDSLSSPVSGSVVRIRTFDYLPGVAAYDTLFRHDTLSGSDGSFLFDNVPPGTYTVECILEEDSLSEMSVVTVDSGASSPLAPMKLQRMALIKGFVPPDDSDGALAVFARGLEHMATVNDQGKFELLVPAGWCRLALRREDDYFQGGIDTLFMVNPGPNDFSAKPRPPERCDSLLCETAIVRALLDSNGLQEVAPESVIVVEDERIVELRLRNLGLHTLTDGICDLGRVRSIDAGENLVTRLPDGIAKMRCLSTLLIDNNKLWVVPSSIGMMRSLRVLDLSENLLQSLPEPVAYLQEVELSLDGNMLCNIGEFTAAWLDHHAPGWRTGQICR